MTDPKTTIPAEIVERVARAIDRYRNPYSKPSDTRHMLHAPEALAALAALPPGALAVLRGEAIATTRAEEVKKNAECLDSQGMQGTAVMLLALLAERDAAVERADVLAQSEAELMQACDDLEAERNAARAEAQAMREALREIERDGTIWEAVQEPDGVLDTERLTDAARIARTALARGGEGG